jgi:hypothetical protein
LVLLLVKTAMMIGGAVLRIMAALLLQFLGADAGSGQAAVDVDSAERPEAARRAVLLLPSKQCCASASDQRGQKRHRHLIEHV